MSLEPKKISELTEDQRLASLVALRGYKSLILMITQSGENDPTFTIIENTTGVVPIISRDDIDNTINPIGSTKIHAPGVFTLGKTVCMQHGGRFLSNMDTYFNLRSQQPSENIDDIYLTTLSDGLDLTDDCFNNNLIQIYISL